MNLEALSAVELANLLDVSEKTVRNWMNLNGLPFSDADRGRTIEWRKALKWWHAYQNKADGNGGNVVKFPTTAEVSVSTETLEQASLRAIRADADLKELKLARERGQVAAIADVERVLAASAKATQTQILAVPSRLATRILGLQDHGRAVAIVEGEMRQLLSNLATIDAVRESTGLPPGDVE